MLPASSRAMTTLISDRCRKSICGPATEARAPHVTTLVTHRRKMKLRILVSLLIGAASGTFCWFLMSHFHQGAADFNWALWGARRLLAGQDPYAQSGALYPLTAILWGIPFARLAPEVAAGLFFGGSSFCMALGLTRAGYHRL